MTSSLNSMHNIFYITAEAYFVLLPISYIFCVMHFNSYAIVAILILVCTLLPVFTLKYEVLL